jgi:hypothetical protein
MGRKAIQRAKEASIIPGDLYLFEGTDVAKTFEYLEKTFRFHSNWRRVFNEQLLTVERGTSEQEFFFKYALQFIEPALKIILRRNDTVIFAIARYIIKDKVKAKQQQQNQVRNMYKNGGLTTL